MLAKIGIQPLPQYTNILTWSNLEMNAIRDLIVLLAIPFIGVWVLISKFIRLFRKAQEK